jgi:hypothetical protein
MGKKKKDKKEKDSAEAIDDLTPAVVDVPVESLGAGIVNLLGDMVGGLVGLGRSTILSFQDGMEVVKRKVEKSVD